MKKVLCFAAAAMALFASCQKTEVVYDNDDPQEIALFAVNKVATKAPVEGSTFLTSDNMDVVAYLAEGEGATAGTFFTETTFNYFQSEGTPAVNVWTGGRYWPISTTTLNFLAVTNTGGNVGGRVENTFTTTGVQSVTSVLSGNEAADQTDLMYAAGQGTHTAGGNYTPVELVFKHALSRIVFNVKTTNTSGANGAVEATDPKITINSITLNGVNVNGTLTINNPNYISTSTATGTSVCNTENLSATWAVSGTTDVIVDKNSIATTPSNALQLNGHPANFGGTNGVLIVPGAQTSFTINYTIAQPDNTEQTFDYTHPLPAASTWDMGKKYTYNVAISLSEIKVAPNVTDWVPEIPTEVGIN